MKNQAAQTPPAAEAEPQVENISRRQFIARLQRQAIFVVPLALGVTLTTPKAMAY